MTKDKSLRRFLYGIYGYAFFNKFLLISPVYAIFMQNHGISEMQLSTLLIVFSLATIATQVPATWLTNKLGYKNAVMFGQLLKGIGFTLFLVWPTFAGFLLGMFLWGTMSAFYGTAYEGLIYDGLRARHHNHIYSRVLGMRYNAQAVGSALAAFGSLVMLWGYEWVTIASLVSIALSMFCISRADLDPNGNQLPVKREKQVSTLKLFKNVYGLCRVLPCMFLSMMLCLMVRCFSYLDDYLSPIGIEIGLPVEYVGLVQFFILACMILGQTYAYRFANVRDRLVFMAICVMGGLLALFSIDYSIGGLLLLGAAYVVMRGLHVLLYSRFQDFVPPAYRTEVLAVYNVIDKSFYTILCLVMGFGGSLGSWRYGIMGVGIMIICVGIWAMMFIGNKCSIANVRKYKSVIKTQYPVGNDIV